MDLVQMESAFLLFEINMKKFEYVVNGIPADVSFANGVFNIIFSFYYKDEDGEKILYNTGLCYPYTNFEHLPWGQELLKNPLSAVELDWDHSHVPANIPRYLMRCRQIIACLIKVVKNPPKFTREEAKPYMSESNRSAESGL